MCNKEKLFIVFAWNPTWTRAWNFQSCVLLKIVDADISLKYYYYCVIQSGNLKSSGLKRHLVKWRLVEVVFFCHSEVRHSSKFVLTKIKARGVSDKTSLPPQNPPRYLVANDKLTELQDSIHFIIFRPHYELLNIVRR